MNTFQAIWKSASFMTTLHLQSAPSCSRFSTERTRRRFGFDSIARYSSHDAGNGILQQLGPGRSWIVKSPAANRNANAEITSSSASMPENSIRSHWLSDTWSAPEHSALDNHSTIASQTAAS